MEHNQKYLDFLKAKEKELVELINSYKLPLKSKIEVLGLTSGLFRGLRTIDSVDKLKKVEADMIALNGLLADYSRDKVDVLISVFLEDFNLFGDAKDVEIYRDYIDRNKEILYMGLDSPDLREILIVILREILLPFLEEAIKIGI